VEPARIASKQASTAATPYRSKSSPSRRAPARQAEHSASRSAARESGIRELRVMIFSALSLGTPRSHSLIGGTMRPSSYTLVAADGMEPGTAPPMSSWWPNAWMNATTSGCPVSAEAANTGTVTHRSGRCPIPPSDR
jgi:hypothetical protein